MAERGWMTRSTHSTPLAHALRLRNRSTFVAAGIPISLIHMQGMKLLPVQAVESSLGILERYMCRNQMYRALH